MQVTVQLGGRAGQRLVGDGVQQRLEAGDLVGFLGGVQLGQDLAEGVLQCGEQVDLAALRFGRAAQDLADHCEAARPGRLRAAVGKPASDSPVQCVAVDAGQQPANHGLGGQSPPGQKRIGVGTDLFPHIFRASIHSPTASSEVAPAGTAHAVRASTRVRHWRTPHGSREVRPLGRPLQQVRAPGSDLRIFAQLVKGQAGPETMPRQARSSTWITARGVGTP
ncbi:hypothetical protein ACH4CE_17385 [Streptomyces gelaticus]|uniref:hypothetical protein n=1 Tax=Streptomyces gelaticus TaxID=285446 RepID=UPI00379088FB